VDSAILRKFSERGQDQCGQAFFAERFPFISNTSIFKQYRHIAAASLGRKLVGTAVTQVTVDDENRFEGLYESSKRREYEGDRVHEKTNDAEREDRRYPNE